MAIPSEVKKTIEIINEKIESLVKLRDSLMCEFGITEARDRREAIDDRQLPMPIPIRPVTTSNRNTRKQQVIEYIGAHGPRSRKEIAAGLGIPEGTVSYVLNDRKLFFPASRGKWDVLPTGGNTGESENTSSLGVCRE